MAAGFIPLAFRSAPDGMANVAPPDTKESSQLWTNSTNFAIWATLRDVRACPKNVRPMLSDFRSAAMLGPNCSSSLFVNWITVLRAMELWNMIFL